MIDLDRTPRLMKLKSSGSTVLIHPCSICGKKHAPFGYGVSLSSGKLGTWYCFECNKQKEGK